MLDSITCVGAHMFLQGFCKTNTVGDMEIETNFQKMTVCQCNNIRRTSRAVTKFYERIMQPCGLKATQYTLLFILKDYGPMTMNDLSEASHLERTTLVRNLKLLVEKGWVVMEKEGPKAYTVKLTEKGRDTWNKAYPYWEQAQQTTKQLLTDDEVNMFTQILEKLESSLSK